MRLDQMNRRSFLTLSGIAATGLLVPRGLLASPASATGATGIVLDAESNSLEGVLVTLNGMQTHTGHDGSYVLQESSSVPEHFPDVSWGKLKTLFDGSGKSLKRSYEPDFIYFEKDGFWKGQHPTDQYSGIAEVNAMLPNYTGFKYGIEVRPEHFGQIWCVMPENTFDRLISYRAQDLPIPVDGTMTEPWHWDLVQASIDRLADAVDEQIFVLAPGNGGPNTASGKTGVFIYHDSYTNSTSPIGDHSTNPEYLLGAWCRLMYSRFIAPDGKTLDHELIWRGLNKNSLSYQNGIFRSPAFPLTDFNREHLNLHRALWLGNQEGINHLRLFRESCG